MTVKHTSPEARICNTGCHKGKFDRGVHLSIHPNTPEYNYVVGGFGSANAKQLKTVEVLTIDAVQYSQHVQDLVAVASSGSDLIANFNFNTFQF